MVKRISIRRVRLIGFEVVYKIMSHTPSIAGGVAGSVNADENVNTQSHTQSLSSGKTWIDEDEKMDELLQNLPSGLRARGIDYNNGYKPCKKVYLSKDSSNFHKGRWMTVKLVEYNFKDEDEDRTPTWEITYHFDGVSGGGDLYTVIKYDNGEFDEVKNTVEDMFIKYIDSDYPNTDETEIMMDRKINYITTETYSKQSDWRVCDLVYDYTRLNRSERKIQLYSWESEYCGFDYYVQFRNPYNGFEGYEYDGSEYYDKYYDKLSPDADSEDIESALEKNVCGILCYEENLELVLNVFYKIIQM